MNKSKSKNKVIALSAVAVSTVAFAAYTTSGLAENKKSQDPTAINLNIDKVDKDTVKISVDNITDAIKSLQLSLQIEGNATFASQDSIKWLIKDSDDLQKEVKISSNGENIDILMLSNNELNRDGSKIDIFEIDVTKVTSLLSSNSNGYKIVPRKSSDNNQTAYSYVITDTNKSKSGNNIINSSDELLKINTIPTISLKDGDINDAIISNGKIDIEEGYDFAKNFRSFVDIYDEDEKLNDDNITLEGEVNTKLAGSYNIKIVVTDSEGEKASIDAIVNVNPEKVTELPTITGVKDSHTIYAGEVYDPMEGISAKDAKGNSINVVLSGDFDLEKDGVYTLTYSATDKWKNVATATTKLTVIKDEAPIITGAVDKTIQKYDNFDPMDGIKVTDDKDKDISSKLKISGSVNNQVVGEYKLSYSVTDSANNTTRVQRIITVEPKVIDAPAINAAPKISGVKDQTIKVGSTFDPMLGVTANDKEDGDLTSKIKIDGSVDTTKVGSYKLVYTVTDSKGAKSTATATITVAKVDAPTINAAPKINGVKDQTINVGSTFDPMLGVTANDKEDGDLTSKIKIDGSVDTTKAGAYKLVYTVTDSKSAKSTATVTITVVQVDEPNIPENPEIPPSILDKIDTNIVDIITGNGKEETPLELEVKNVSVKDLNSFLSGLKELTPFVESISKDSDYTVYRVKMKNKDNSILSGFLDLFKSDNNIYTEIKVKNSYTELVDALNIFAKDSNPSIVIPQPPNESNPPESGDKPEHGDTTDKPSTGDNSGNGDPTDEPGTGDNSGNGDSTNKPSTGDNSVNNNSPDKPNGNIDNPKSGDTGMLSLFGIAAVASGALFIRLSKRNKK